MAHILWSSDSQNNVKTGLLPKGDTYYPDRLVRVPEHCKVTRRVSGVLLSGHTYSQARQFKANTSSHKYPMLTLPKTL